MSSRLTQALGATLVLALFLSPNLHARIEPETRADCERLYTPQYAQAGKDVIWIPTSDELVARMLKMAKTGPDDYVMDLGAGDGKIVIAAARDFGARALGIEYDPKMVELGNCLTRVEKVSDRAQIRRGDIFKENFSQADVITLYLLDSLNLCLRHRLLAMTPGTRIASHSFSMGDWVHDDKVSLASGSAYLWIVPARVGGRWKFSDSDGRHRFDVQLTQSFQDVEGEASIKDERFPLDATLHGDVIWFTFADRQGATHIVKGDIRDRRITGLLKAKDGEKSVYGELVGSPAAGEWAAMAAGCSHHYEQ
jgi:hypothetical protein